MKKIIILFSVFIALSASAQNIEVTNAYNYLKYGELDLAKESIDKASVNEKTSLVAKTFYYKGLIYQAIDASEDPKYKGLDPLALSKAYEAFNKCLELDVKKQFTEDIQRGLPQIAAKFTNNGINAYNAKDYATALENFENVVKITPNDTGIIFNCAITAQLAKNNEKAKKHLSTLVGMKYDQPEVYRSLANIYKSENDTPKALEILAQGKEVLPGNAALIIDELNIYLLKGQTDVILTKLDAAITADPQNKVLYFAKGTTLDNLGKKQEAIELYNKAIELDPAYFDAIYNLGALYYNQGVETFNRTNNLPVSKEKEFKAGTEKFKKEFQTAMPILEKALELNPTDKNTLLSLKEIYAKLDLLDKSQQMKKRLEGGN